MKRGPIGALALTSPTLGSTQNHANSLRAISEEKLRQK